MDPIRLFSLSEKTPGSCCKISIGKTCDNEATVFFCCYFSAFRKYVCFFRLVNCLLSCVLWSGFPHSLTARKEGTVDQLQEVMWILPNIRFRLGIR